MTTPTYPLSPFLQPGTVLRALHTVIRSFLQHFEEDIIGPTYSNSPKVHN